MSGLAAARELQHRRYDVLVVEARSRVGGRVWGAPVEVVVEDVIDDNDDHNDHDGAKDCVVDLGGALIHGTMGNPLSQLCVQLGVATTDNLADSLLLDANGWPVDAKQDEKVAQMFNEALDKTFDQIARQGDQQEIKNGHKRHRTIATATATATDAHQEAEHAENDQEQPAEQVMEDNFGHLFDKIALREYGSSVVDSALWMWYQANLEIQMLGLKW